MNIAEPFIRRPVMTTLVMAALLIFGVMAYQQLPVSDLPQVDFPTIQVSASLPGASPETMAASVATPLERQFTTIAGLDSMTSSSQQGRTQITLQFNLSRDIDAAAQDVQSALSRATRLLPQDMPSPPSFQKVNPADQPVLFLALTSPTLPLYQLDEYAETDVSQRISTVAGVAQVQVFGSQKYAVRIQVDPQKLAAKGIGIDEVVNSIQNSNVNMPTGIIDGNSKQYTVQATGQLVDATSYRPVIIAYRNGNPVRLQEVGTAIDSVENNKTAAWFSDQRGVILAVQRQPGTNTVAVVKEVRKILPELQARLPASVKMDILSDRSETINESVADVKFTLWLSLVLVIAVIFVFLRNVRATIIPSLAIPMSLIGTFAVMYVMGYSLDNLSLMALTLSIGFVVDDAIVMLENCVRHIELGEKPLAATLIGSREIGFTIVSMTISLVAVFVPVLFMPGILGRLLNEFAVVIAVSILFSGLVSLTLTPMLCSRFLKAGSHAHGHFYRATEKLFDGMLWIYEVGLRAALKFRVGTLLISAAVLLGTGYLFVKMPKGFLPDEDIGQIRGNTEAAEGVSFADLRRYQKQAADIIQADPDVEGFMSVAGARGAANAGMFNIRLKSRDQRTTSAQKIIERLRPQLAQVPGLKTVLQLPPPIQIGGQVTKGQYQFSLQGADTDELFEIAPKLEAKMRELPGLQDVSTDLLLRNPQLLVEIDRDRAATLGISAERIESALASAYGSQQISTIYQPTNTYQVILELIPEFQRNPEDLPLLYISSVDRRLVPIRSLTKLSQNLGPLSVNHVGQLPAVTISFNLRPGYSVGDAVSSVRELAAKEQLPASISTSFQGTAQVFESSLKGLGILLLVSVLIIYIVLGVLYESFIHPITILTALPFAGFGALVTLKLFNKDLDLYGFVGIIMLVGLVKKNGIMMVDFAIESQRNHGKKAVDAIYEACVVRFRPIMMTTMAALLGTLPIAMGIGAGAESRQGLGLAVVGGLLFSQLLTLFVTPVFYVYFDKLRAAFAGRPEPVRREVAEPVEQLV